MGGRLGSLQEFKILLVDTKLKNGMLLLTSSLNYLKQIFLKILRQFFKTYLYLKLLFFKIKKKKKRDILGTLRAVILATTNVKKAVQIFLELLTACNFSR